MGAVKFPHRLWNKMCTLVAMASATRADTSLALASASGSAISCFWKVKIYVVLTQVKGLACLEQ